MIPTDAIMQTCAEGMKGYEYLTQFKFIKSFTCTYAAKMGLLLFGTFVYGGVSLVYYITQGSAIIPFILLLLIGGGVMNQVAGPVVGIATVLLLMGGAAVVTLLYDRYSR